MNSSVPERRCKLLEWDSHFFGCTIAAVVGDALDPGDALEINRWCEEHKVDCLYFQANPRDAAAIRVAEGDGYRLVDVRVTLEGTTERAEQPPPEPLIRRVTREDVLRLREIAAESHRDGRFHFDGTFPMSRADALYAEWIRASCDGYAEQVLVSGPPGAPTGYVTCHLEGPGPSGKIGLLAVESNSRRAQLGQALMRGALYWFGGRGAARVTVVTQGRNVPALRLYQRCGFLTGDLRLYYHKWFSSPQWPG